MDDLIERLEKLFENDPHYIREVACRAVLEIKRLRRTIEKQEENVQRLEFELDYPDQPRHAGIEE